MAGEEELKHLLMRMKEESEKAGLKLNIQKLRSLHPVPSLYGKYKGKGLQNHCRLIVAMKLKDANFLEEKL